MLGCTVGKSKQRIRLPELGTNQSHSLSVSYMSLRLLRMCLQYIQGRRCTFHSQCRKYYRSGMQDRSYSEYSVGWASLSCRQLLSHQILSCTHTPHLHNHHQRHNQHRRHWKPLSRTCHPQNQHSTCMCVCRFYFCSCTYTCRASAPSPAVVAAESLLPSSAVADGAAEVAEDFAEVDEELEATEAEEEALVAAMIRRRLSSPELLEDNDKFSSDTNTQCALR
ncbi:hypothetical protein PsorP6_002721 [Peronosclerospora sorghi]|uniref:Uncharacterized protein n=1 Tax=Peronosclerospora sorghi TaxID=230839 RepID=A0ACC0WSD2_9STRA|nr:hypothetical protein PsorP6_002721 [Peronosclerospora sorghi]